MKSLPALVLAFICLSCAGKEPDLGLLVFDAVAVTDQLQLPHEQPLTVKAAMEQMARRPFTSGDHAVATDIATLQATLNQQELKGNAYDKSLTEILQELGSAYEQEGEYEQALSSYRRANQIIRVNNGLFSLDQVPLLRHMISNNMALGDLAATDAAQEYLYYLRAKAFARDSPELIPALQDFAAWNALASHIYLPQSSAEKSGAATANPKTMFQFADTQQEQFDLRFRHLQQAQQLYQRIIDILLAHGDTKNSALGQAEFALATSNFFMTRQLMTYNRTHGTKDLGADYFQEIDLHKYHSSFQNGRTALERRVNYLAESASTTPADLAHARLDLVDWLIATGSSIDYKPLLETAWRDYAASGASTAEVEKLFAPLVPVAVPAFEIMPNTRASLGIASDTAIDYRGYVDVDYSVNVSGDSTVPKILSSTAGTPQEVVDTLQQSIINSRFRPRIQDGLMAPYEHVVVRYHYAW